MGIINFLILDNKERIKNLNNKKKELFIFWFINSLFWNWISVFMKSNKIEWAEINLESISEWFNFWTLFLDTIQENYALWWTIWKNKLVIKIIDIDYDFGLNNSKSKENIKNEKWKITFNFGEFFWIIWHINFYWKNDIISSSWDTYEIDDSYFNIVQNDNYYKIFTNDIVWINWFNIPFINNFIKFDELYKYNKNNLSSDKYYNYFLDKYFE